MKAVVIGVLFMVISPLHAEDAVYGVYQRDRHESAQKAESRVGISGGTRQGRVTKRAEGFKRYIGLGDSISIDEYAGGPGWGAISLFYRNKDKIYPEFKGKDLCSLYPGIDLYSLASDGAISSTVLSEQLSALPPRDGDPTIVTLTVGGNDFLSSLWPGGGIDRGSIDDFRLDLTKILGTIRERYPNCTIILGTIYDPTDGVGDLGIPDVDVQEGYALFHTFNRAILDIGKSHGAHIADIYSHFLGHGSHHEDPKNPHYCGEDPSHWFVQEIEPNARGAHEIRRLFWEAFQKAIRGDD